MSRALVLLFALCSCGGPPCGDWDGGCLTVEVRGTGEVDQLQIDLSGQATFHGKTDPLGTPATLPVRTAIRLPATAAGTVDLTVTGYRANLAIGQSQPVSITVVPRQMQSVSTDLKLRRYAFVHSEVFKGKLGTSESADAICTQEADSHHYPGRYRALLGYRGTATGKMNDRIALDDREIYSLNGHIIPNGSALFSSMTSSWPLYIDLNSGEHSNQCAWTNFDALGNVLSNDCDGWTTDSAMTMGGHGKLGGPAGTWALDGGPIACDTNCYLLCLGE